MHLGELRLAWLSLVVAPSDLARVPDPRSSTLRPLPIDVSELQLTEQLEAGFPTLVFDRVSVLYGSATHDIGKVEHRNELTGPGHQHEPAGYRLLVAYGVPARLARFARTTPAGPNTNQLSAYQKAAGTDLKLLRLPGETEFKRPGMTLLPSQYYSIYARSKHQRQAALLVNYLVNSTEAGQLILTDRGLPSNPTVRSAIQSSLAPADQASAEFVDRISKISSPATAPAPASSSGQNDITYNIDSQVLFGKLTPSAAGSAWLDQMKASMAGSVQ